MLLILVPNIKSNNFLLALCVINFSYFGHFEVHFVKFYKLYLEVEHFIIVIAFK